jgi:hypothetical protein
MIHNVAALFVDPKGPYPKMEGVDCWDETRDARLYAGPHPTVCHPPCQLWGNFAAINFKRWGGEHNRPGNDQGCFVSALNSVRMFGGVLEHPAGSKAWAHYGLYSKFGSGGYWVECSFENDRSYWTCEIWQSAYGHRARKRTWLLYCGKVPPYELNWKRVAGTHQIGYADQRGKARNKPTVPKHEAIHTPVAFAEELVRLARHSTGNT